MTRLLLKNNQKENPVSKEASNAGNFCKDKGKTGKEKAQTIKGYNDHKGQKKGNNSVNTVSRKGNLLSQGNQAKQLLPFHFQELEGTNKIIKDIKCLGFGFRNFINFRKRVLSLWT